MYSVIFDTNAYRNLVYDTKNLEEVSLKISNIKKLEKSKNVTTLISPTVGRELLSHIVDKNDRNYNNCIKAIKAMYEHCTNNDGTYNLLATPEIQIARDLFYVENTPAIESAKAICQMLYHFSKDQSDTIFNTFDKNLKLNKDHIITTEQLLSDDIYKWIRLIDPAATSWKVFENDEKKRKKLLSYLDSQKFDIEIAAAFLCAIDINIAEKGLISNGIKQEKIQDMIKKFIEMYKTPISLQRHFYKQFIFCSFDLSADTSRCNFIWDIHILYAAGQTINNSPTILITNDKAMTNEVTKVCAPIMKYDDYMKFLNS
jgi:hypothetical protein